MKKIFVFLCIITMSLASCSQFDDVALWNKSMNIESRISKLEELCEQMNTNITSLQIIVNAVQENDYVTSVTPIYEGGKEVGYTITFSKSKPATIYHGKDGQNGTNGKDGQNGKDGYTPKIGVKQDTDGIYYWTRDGEWLTDDSGNKIKAEGRDGQNGADGITPQLKIEDGDWWFSTDNGESWQNLSKDGQSGDGGDSFFKDVDTSNPNYVIFTLSDGTELKLPKYSQLSITFDTEDVLMIARNAAKKVTYTIVSNISDIEIEVMSSSDITTKTVKSSATKGEITVSTGNYIDEDSHILVLVSNGEKTIMKRLDIKIDLEIPELMEQMFPDPNFRKYVLDNFDTNKDGKISQEEALKVTSISCGFREIKSLEGVQYFTNLTFLSCHDNQLTSLDVSKNTALTYLSCYFNQLTSLDVSGCTALTDLTCDSNTLTSLNVSGCTALTNLDYKGRQLTSLNVSGCTALTKLQCNRNQLTSLDVSGCTALTTLDCFSNQLTTLDVSGCMALTELSCYSNQLTSLDVSQNTALTTLSCSENKLADLNVSQNTALTYLSCYSNHLTSLDVSQNTALTYLSCSSNQLTSLDVSHNTALTSLSCYSNQLTSLDVSHNTALTSLQCYDNQLTELDVSQNTALTSLKCYSNKLTRLDVSKCSAMTSLDCRRNPLAEIVVKQGQSIDISTDNMDVVKYVE